MNAEKYTKKSIEAINNARSIAAENKNQYLTPAHLLYSLLDQDGGLIGSIFTKMGTDTDAVLSELDTVINGLPRVSGGSGEVYASSETAASLESAALEQAQNEAKLVLSEAQYAADGILKQANKLAEMREKKVIAETEKRYEEAIALVIDHLTD